MASGAEPVYLPGDPMVGLVRASDGGAPDGVS